MQIGRMAAPGALGRGTPHPTGIAAAAGRVVVVGDTTLPDGTTVPWIATATAP